MKNARFQIRKYKCNKQLIKFTSVKRIQYFVIMFGNKLNQKIFISLVSLIGLYALWCCFGYYNQVRLQKVPYYVVETIRRSQDPNSNSIGHSNKIAEIRQYPSFNVVQAIYKGVDLSLAMDMGLQDIGAYLLGKNSGSQKLEMALPVIIQRIPYDNAYAISFAIPRSYSLQSLPTPLDKRLSIKEIPARKMAALAWRGRFPSQDQTEHKKKKLQSFLLKSRYSITGNMFLFEYDSPMTPGWIRKNDILFEIKQRPLVALN